MLVFCFKDHNLWLYMFIVLNKCTSLSMQQKHQLAFYFEQRGGETQGLWSATDSPVNHAQGRGALLGERAFIFLAGEAGLHPFHSVRSATARLCRMLPHSETPKFLSIRKSHSSPVELMKGPSLLRNTKWAWQRLKDWSRSHLQE